MHTTVHSHQIEVNTHINRKKCLGKVEMLEKIQNLSFVLVAPWFHGILSVHDSSLLFSWYNIPMDNAVRMANILHMGSVNAS